MTEIIKDENKVEPQTHKENIQNTATTPLNDEKDIIIPVKFNKEVKELTIEQASALAQKGMKYDAISKEYEQLKALALAENKSVPEFIEGIALGKKNEKIEQLCEKCGGDRALAEHIFELEQEKTEKKDVDIEEIKEYFPNIKKLEDLPDQVVTSAQLKGSNLLDEYLRFLLSESRAEKNTLKSQTEAKEKSLGSQQSSLVGENPEAAEFLKGLWK